MGERDGARDGVGDVWGVSVGVMGMDVMVWV